jgi:hypothetical protein
MEKVNGISGMMEGFGKSSITFKLYAYTIEIA